MDTDPYPAFLDVQCDIVEKTSHTIHWNNKYDCSKVNRFVLQALEHELTMDDVIQISLLNNQRLQAIYERIGVAQAELVQAGLFKNPIFNFSLRFHESPGSHNVIEMGLLQNFLDILLKPLKTKMAYHELKLVKNQIIGAVLEIIADTKIAFYSLQTAEQNLTLRKQILTASELAYDAAERLREAGNISNLDLIVKRILFEQSKIDFVDAEIETVEVREKLNVLMGLWGSMTKWSITNHLEEIPIQPPKFSNIEHLVVTHSLDLYIKRQNIFLALARNGIDISTIILPELSIGPDLEKESDGKWFLGPQIIMGIPLFDFGQAQTAKARSEINQLYQEYYATAVEIRSAARSVICKLQKAHRQSRSYQDILLPLAEEITSESLTHYNAMQIGVFDILLAKQQEIEARSRAIFAYRDYWKACVELEMLISGKMIHQSMQ